MRILTEADSKDFTDAETAPVTQRLGTAALVTFFVAPASAKVQA